MIRNKRKKYIKKSVFAPGDKTLPFRYTLEATVGEARSRHAIFFYACGGVCTEGDA